jgi:hypothetical protein
VCAAMQNRCRLGTDTHHIRSACCVIGRQDSSEACVVVVIAARSAECVLQHWGWDGVGGRHIERMHLWAELPVIACLVSSHIAC